MNDQTPSRFDSFRMVVDEIPDPVWVVDADLRFVFVNEFLLERGELSKSEWLGKPLVELWDREVMRIENSDSLLNALEDILTGVTSERQTEVTITNDHETVTRTVKSIPWTVDGKIEGVLNIARDITDQRSRERQLKILDRVLRHNVRNEMSVITGNAQIIEQLGDEEAADYASNIRTTAERLLETVKKERDIVDVIRKELTRSEVDLLDVIDRRIESIRTESTISVSTELPDQVQVSALEVIDRAIEELLQNAIEHNDGPTPRIHVAVESVDDYYELSISDNGPGIPEEEVGVLTAAEIQPLYHGSGLGLWLVNWVVEESGGSLSFGDADIGGSTVTIRLPKT